jgi:hypothetical protein
MYIELMKKNQNAHALDSGLTMIAAGLSPYQDSRTALINAASKAEAGNKMQLSAADLINLQKQQLDMKQRALRQSLLPALAREHQLSPETIAALEASGKLDEVLQSFSTKGLTHIKDEATGETAFFDRHGNKVASAGGGLKPTDDQREWEAYNADQAKRGGKPLSFGDYMSTVKRAAPAATDEAILASINKDRPPDKQMTMEYFQTNIKHKATTEINVSPDGTHFPKPEPGFDYKRTPEGKVWINPETQLPEQVPVSTRAEARLEQTEAQTEHTQTLTEAERHKLNEIKKKENRERVAAAFSAHTIGREVDRALVNADVPGASGFGAGLVRADPFKLYTPATTLDANLRAINANNMISALKDLRSSSPTGAGLGSVSNFEDKQLASMMGSLDPTQGTKQLKENLIAIKAAVLVMAENKYENEGDKVRFLKDLKEKTDELTAAHISSSSKGVRRVREVPRE